jgi:hypothetical protein
MSKVGWHISETSTDVRKSEKKVQLAAELLIGNLKVIAWMLLVEKEQLKGKWYIRLGIQAGF